MAADFDLRALYAALDGQRAERGLSWAALARAIGVSAPTLRGLGERPSAEGDGVLQVLGWLGRTPESFLAQGGTAPDAAPLPDARPPGILRFDARALYAALDAERIARGLTWREVAAESGASGSAALTRLRAGGRVAFPEVMRVLGWLGAPAARFVRIAA